MAKTKLMLVCLLLATGINLPAREYTWKRYLMDGSRTGGKAVSELDGTARKAAVLIASYQIPESSGEVVGWCPDPMSRERPQSALTNWFADMLLEEGSRLSGETCDVVLTNFGSVRKDLPSGNVYYDDIKAMLPFPNSLVVVKMRGSKLLDNLNKMAAGEFDILSGVKVVAGRGEVESVTVGGSPLDPDRLYNVVSNGFLLENGDGYNLRNDSESVFDSGKTVFEVTIEHLRRMKAEGKPMQGSVDDRVILKFPPVEPPLPAETGKRPVADDGRRTLTILHTNDTHSNIDPIRGGQYEGKGGIVERAALIDSVRRADGRRNVLLLDAGDFNQGTPYYSRFGGEVELKAMNILGYDAGTTGNHEWDNGSSHLKNRLKRLNQSMVLCNYTFDDKNLSRYLKPYTIIRKAGYKIGIVGVLADITQLVDKKKVELSISYKDPVESINRQAAFLKNEKKCDLVIVLSHCGSIPNRDEKGDAWMAGELHNVDIIIGGHSHTDWDKPYYFKDADGKPVMVVTDKCWGIYVGEIKL